jgi:hypothetical protein
LSHVSRLPKRAAALFSVILTFSSTLATAQTSDELSGDAYLAYLQSLAEQTSQTPSAGAAPSRDATLGATVGIPSGFTMGKNTGFAAISFSDVRERRTSGSPDGSIALGMGFGDPERIVGFEAILGISSIGGGTGGAAVDLSDFGDSGSLNLKISRRIASPFSGGVASLALGAGRVARWGDMSAAKPNYYAAYSSSFTLGSAAGNPMSGLLSAGYGSAIGSFEDTAGAFLGLGLGLGKGVSVGASWYGNEAILGATATRKLNSDRSLQIGLSYSDVGQQNSSGRWVVSFAVIDADLF